MHPACQAAGIRLALVVTRVDVALDQLRNLLAKGIKDHTCHI